MELVDETKRVATKPRPSVIVERRGLFAPDLDGTLEAALEQANRLQQGGLARSRRTEKGNDLAGPDGEVHAAQHLDRNFTLREAAPQIAGFEDRLTHSAAPAPDRYSQRPARGTAWRCK